MRRFCCRLRDVIGGELWERLIGAETVDDTTLFQIVGRHFHFHAIARQNPHSVDSHTSRERAEQLVILRLRTQDANSERGIGERFLNNADEFDDVFRHAR